jgi:hypothetical protein
MLFEACSYTGKDYTVNAPVLSLVSTKLVENKYDRTIGVNFDRIYELSRFELDLIERVGQHFDKITLVGVFSILSTLELFCRLCSFNIAEIDKQPKNRTR